MKYQAFEKDKLILADKYYDEWSSKFKCDRLEEYYEGFQWKIAKNYPINSFPYTINLIYATIETKMANMLLNNPQFDAEVKPRFSDFDQEMAFASAEIKQDALNTIIENPNLCFTEQIRLAALDYFFRFCVIEVGYAADWQNPNKAAPITKSDIEGPTYTRSKDKIIDDLELPVDEYVFFKWIPARRFRVSLSDSPLIRNCSSVQYYSYFYREVLDNMDGISFKEGYQELQNPQFSPEYKGPSRIIGAAARDEKEDPELEYLIRSNEVCKVWTQWNNKIKKKQLIYDDSGHVCWQDDFDYIPLATHRGPKRLKGWYPIPPVWYWLSPQDEVNEAREQMRNYRRRFKRKFAFLKGKIVPSELEKLGSDIDGEAIEEKERESIRAISNPEIGISIESALNQSFSDFNHVSGTAQVRESDRETATKSKIISMKEQVRENVERSNFDNFVCEIGRLGLVVMSERLTLPMWIKYTTDPSENFLNEVQDKGPAYRLITTQQLDDGYDFTVKLRVVDASETQTEAEMQKFVAFLSIVNQFPQVALDPILIREAAHKTGYRNIRVIRRMQQMATVMMMGAVNQAQGASQGNGVPGNNQNANKSAIANSAPNPSNEIQQQLFSQV